MEPITRRNLLLSSGMAAETVAAGLWEAPADESSGHRLKIAVAGVHFFCFCPHFRARPHSSFASSNSQTIASLLAPPFQRLVYLPVPAAAPEASSSCFRLH
jgi:hypothetical protein